MLTPKQLVQFYRSKLTVAIGVALLIIAAQLAALPVNSYAQSTSDACKNTTAVKNLQNCVQSNQIVKDLQAIITALTAGIAVIIVIMVIVGGIQYAMAGGGPETTKAAKQRITNALIALIALLFTWAFLQWLIPGGVFG